MRPPAGLLVHKAATLHFEHGAERIRDGSRPVGLAELIANHPSADEMKIYLDEIKKCHKICT